MRGIILAGGAGTRMGALTRAVSKQLLPVYDKPVIYYPLATLISAGIRDILVISTPRDIGPICALLNEGKRWGVRISYAEQPRPDGIARALIIGESFIAHNSCCLILGDNVFHAPNIGFLFKSAAGMVDESLRARIFAHAVPDPRRFGVVTLDENDTPIHIEEKPTEPRSNLAVTGIYMYPPGVSEVARHIKPSARGELEITDVTRVYLETSNLDVTVLGRNTFWMDVGTPRALLEASNHVRWAADANEQVIGCPDAAAAGMGFIKG